MFGWIGDSVIVFFSSVAMYLFIRFGQRQQIPVTQYLLAMFIIPLICYAIAVPIVKSSFFLPIWQIGIIALVSVVFSFVGNILSQKSILLASNPGYSLTITKAYVIVTTLFAVLFFHSHLTFQTGLAILFIVVFSGFISIGKMTTGVKDNTSWIAMAIGAFFCFAGLALASTYILSIGVNIFVWLFYLFLFVSICIGIDMFVRKVKLVMTKSSLLTIIIIGILSMLFNLFTQLGYKHAPNPGYINAVNAASIVLLTPLSAFFFKDELSKRKIIGVIGVIAGLLLLFL